MILFINTAKSNPKVELLELQDASLKLMQNKFDLFAIGIGEDVDENELKSMAPSRDYKAVYKYNNSKEFFAGLDVPMLAVCSIHGSIAVNTNVYIELTFYDVRYYKIDTRGGLKNSTVVIRIELIEGLFDIFASNSNDQKHPYRDDMRSFKNIGVDEFTIFVPQKLNYLYLTLITKSSPTKINLRVSRRSP